MEGWQVVEEETDISCLVLSRAAGYLCSIALVPAGVPRLPQFQFLPGNPLLGF